MKNKILEYSLRWAQTEIPPTTLQIWFAIEVAKIYRCAGYKLPVQSWQIPLYLPISEAFSFPILKNLGQGGEDEEEKQRKKPNCGREACQVAKLN